MNKQYNYKNILKEAMILTLAVGIIAAAVYFFLVPSHTSVSSISNLWQRIWCKNSLYKYYATCFSCIF